MVKKYSTYLKEKKEKKFTIEAIQLLFQLDEKAHNYKNGCEYLKNLLSGKKIVISTIFRKNKEYMRFSDSSKNFTMCVMDVVRPKNSNYAFVDKNLDEYEPVFNQPIFYWDDEETYERDKKIYEVNSKEKERKKEELRLKMMDIDPYGEEDWEN